MNTRLLLLAFMMRAYSSVSMGLWSWVIATAVPALDSTHRESPAEMAWQGSKWGQLDA